MLEDGRTGQRICPESLTWVAGCLIGTLALPGLERPFFNAGSGFATFFIVGTFTSGHTLDGATASASVFRPEPNAENSCTVSTPVDTGTDGLAVTESVSDGTLERMFSATTIAPNTRSVPAKDRTFIRRSCQPSVNDFRLNGHHRAASPYGHIVTTENNIVGTVGIDRPSAGRGSDANHEKQKIYSRPAPTSRTLVSSRPSGKQRSSFRPATSNREIPPPLRSFY